jgi:hypothetical protein
MRHARKRRLPTTQELFPAARLERRGTIELPMDIGFSNARCRAKTLWNYGIAKSPQPGARAKEQCLGDMP